MALTSLDADLNESGTDKAQLTFQADGSDRIELPSSEFIADAKMTKDGDDLVLETPNGEVAVIEGYFSADPAPSLHSPDGSVLTPNLVDAFAHSPQEYAANASANDQSPVGAVEEVSGHATVTRADGTVETISIGTPIYQGDVIETDATGAVNITFIDETIMAVSENARFAVDQYTFDPASENGTTNFSMLRGVFVFTSGLIGRDDPDDVHINTPVGSIGIRGTIIAGAIHPGGESTVSVLEGAIVITNGAMATTLSQQFETVKIGGFNDHMESMGVLPAADIGARFSSVSGVFPSLFTTINDAAQEQSNQPQNQSAPEPQSMQDSPSNTQTAQPADTAPHAPDLGLSNNLMGNSFTGSNSGLPSANVIAGQSDASVSSASHAPAPAPSIPAPVADTSHAASVPAPVNTPPVSTIPTPPLPVETAPPVVDVPPVVVTPPVLGALALTHTLNAINDVAQAGHVIGTVSAGESGVTYALATADPNYALVANGNGVNVVLTARGAQYFASTLEVPTLNNFTVVATRTADNAELSHSENVVVSNANADSTYALNNLKTTQVLSATYIDDHANTGTVGVGYSIAALGDLNKDGFDDFGFTASAGSVLGNRTFQYMGSTSTGHVDLANTTTVVVEGNPSLLNPSNTLITGIGDFNGDGINDYALGQSAASIVSTTGYGNASIISGGAGVTVLASFTTTAGISPNAAIGSSISGIGDYNNDGYADVIIGAPGQGAGGAAFLVKGHNGTGDNLTTSAVKIEGLTGASFGTSVKGIGDVNGDGYMDFAVGAPASGASNQGAVYIYHGNQSGTISTPTTISGPVPATGFGSEIMALGDINGDGYSDFAIGSEGTSGQIVLGGNAGTLSFNFQSDLPGAPVYTLAGAGAIGDYNGDGYDDFVIGLGIDAAGTNSTDGVHDYIVFGKANMQPMDLGYLKNPENAIELRYTGDGGNNEFEVAGIGDVNGDGYDDFAFGISTAGEVIVIHGSGTSTPMAQVGNAGDNTLNDNGATGVSMRGGAGNDTIVVSNTNFLGIDGGSNTAGGDTLKMMGNLDFSAVNYEKISGIEKLQFGEANQTITLTLENLFNLMKTSDDGTLTIKGTGLSGLNLILQDTVSGDNYTGSEQDQVKSLLQSNGATVTPGTDSGYDTFSIGGYKLLIDTAITVDAQ